MNTENEISIKELYKCLYLYKDNFKITNSGYEVLLDNKINTKLIIDLNKNTITVDTILSKDVPHYFKSEKLFTTYKIIASEKDLANFKYEISKHILKKMVT